MSAVLHQFPARKTRLQVAVDLRRQREREEGRHRSMRHFRECRQWIAVVIVCSIAFALGMLTVLLALAA
jgi:hypothetical protein